MNLTKYCLLILLFFSKKTVASEQNSDPIFSGTLLAFFSHNVAPGKISIQPYLFATRLHGKYNGNSSMDKDRNIHQYNGLLSTEIGLTEKIDFSLDFNASYIHTSCGDLSRFGDIFLFFGFQIAKDQPNTWIPDVRFVIGENFPTGNYKNLDPDKKLGDATGIGSFATTFVVIFGKVFYTWPNHPYNLNLNILTSFFSKTDVKGFNVYGGGLDTKGEIQPGPMYLFNLSFEYKLNQPWEVGIDIQYEHGMSGSFISDQLGTTVAFASSSELFSLAPCIAYNFSHDFSFITGVWFSLYGRNSLAFTSTVFTVFYEF